MAEPSAEAAAAMPDVEKNGNDVEKSTPMEDDTNYPTGLALAAVLSSVLMAMFLVALDRTIISTAIPSITNHFNSIGDIGWYGSAFLLTNAAFQPLFGRIYKFHPPKQVFLIAIAIFEIGSAICGAAPSSAALIIGRAISGFGSSGIFSGVMVINMHTIPLHKRPLFMGAFGAVFGIASVVGPLLGGVFTESVSWRWCFYINLPIGAITIFILIFLLKLPHPKERLTLREQIARLDPLGTAIFLPCTVCLLLALQWGGATYPWSNWRIILLLVLFGLLLIAFITSQLWLGDRALIPPRIISQRSIACGTFFSACAGGGMMLIVYYLPVWFQAIKGVNALHSGLMTIPLILSLVIASILSGIVTKKSGQYVPPMLVCPILMSIGAGLLSTFTPYTGHAKWIGYQFIFGFGIGLAMQQAALAAQAVLSKADASIGISLIFFAQQLGGAVFLAIGQQVFDSKLVSGLSGLTGLPADRIVNTGATDIRHAVPAMYLPQVLSAYNAAITKVFLVGTAMASIMILGALGMEWKSIKEVKPAVKKEDQTDGVEKEPTESVDAQTEKPAISSDEDSHSSVDRAVTSKDKEEGEL